VYEGRRSSCHVCKVVLGLENGLCDGNLTIEPAKMEALKMGSSKISKLSFILSIIIITITSSKTQAFSFK
jgi:hypothetical protein